MPRVTNSQMYEYINTNKYIASFVKGKTTSTGEPLNAIGTINHIKLFISSIPNGKETKSLLNSLDSIKEVIKFLDSSSKSHSKDADLSWMSIFENSLKQFGRSVTSFYNANGYSLAEKDEMMALKGINQFVDRAISNIDQLHRSKALDNIYSTNRTLKSESEKLEAKGIDFINKCKNFDKLFKEGELDYTKLDYQEGIIDSKAKYHNYAFVRFRSQLAQQGIKYEKYLIYGDLCDQKKENQDKLNSLNSKYINDCNSAKAIKRYLNDYDEASARITTINKDKEESEKIQSSIQDEIYKLESKKEEAETKLSKFDQKLMDDSIKAYELYSVVDSLKGALNTLQSLSDSGISMQEVNDSFNHGKRHRNGGLKQEDFNSLNYYFKSVLALKNQIPGKFDNIVDQLNKRIITEPAEILSTYKDVIQEQIALKEKEAQKYERPTPDIMNNMDDYRTIKQLLEKVSSSIDEKTKQNESITSSIKELDEKIANENSKIEQLKSDANQVLNAVLLDSEKKELSFTEIQAVIDQTIEKDKEEIGKCKSVDEKLNNHLNSFTNIKKEVAVSTSNLFKNLKHYQNAQNYIQGIQGEKDDLSIDNEDLIKEEKAFQSDVSKAKDVNIYKSISDKLTNIMEHIYDKTSDPNNAKPGEKGNNSDQFFYMYTKLANAIEGINDPLKTQEQKAKMITDLTASAKTYLDAKAEQFRPFPSEQRRARIAFAQEILDFKETAMDMLKNTDEREKTLQEFLKPVNKTKNIDTVLKGYEEKMHTMHKDAKSTVKEADAHTVQESHRAI